MQEKTAHVEFYGFHEALGERQQLELFVSWIASQLFPHRQVNALFFRFPFFIECLIQVQGGEQERISVNLRSSRIDELVEKVGQQLIRERKEQAFRSKIHREDNLIRVDSGLWKDHATQRRPRRGRKATLIDLSQFR